MKKHALMGRSLALQQTTGSVCVATDAFSTDIMAYVALSNQKAPHSEARKAPPGSATWHKAPLGTKRHIAIDGVNAAGEG